MRGLPLIDPETADGEAAQLLAAAQRILGITPNMTKAMANSPAALKGYLEFHRVLRDGSLPETLCEQIALLVAQENESDYCLSAHTYLGTRVAGLTAEQAVLARSARADEPAAAAALGFAAAVVRGRGAVSDEDLAAARRAGLTAETIAEIIAHVALNVFTTYLTKAARVAVDWPLIRHDDPNPEMREEPRS